MAERKQIDWEAIEREYRAGQLSVREISRQYGVGAPSIVKKAAKLGWERDLSDSVRQAVKAKLVKETAQGNTEGKQVNTREAVEAAAARGVDIVLRHRRDIAKLDALRTKLAEKAETLLDTVASIDALGNAAQAVESLGRTMARLVPLERQAFNLDAQPEGGGADTLSKEQRDAAFRAATEADR